MEIKWRETPFILPPPTSIPRPISPKIPNPNPSPGHALPRPIAGPLRRCLRRRRRRRPPPGQLQLRPLWPPEEGPRLRLRQRQYQPHIRSDPHRLRRALSFDAAAPPPPEAEAAVGEWEEEEALVEVLRAADAEGADAGGGGVPGVAGGGKEGVEGGEELRLRVSPQSQIGFVGSVLQKCAGIQRLMLTMESDADSTVLACVAFSCPNLESFEIHVADSAVNRITGDELSRFVAEKRSLSILKIGGCINLGFLNLCSSTLSTLWLSDLYCISKSAINCPNLRELSLDFTRQENDSTDLITMMDSLGRTCPRLQNMHVASIQLCNEAVLALAGAHLRGLRMLSLVLGSKITDASVAAIVSCFTSLELLDLSGSSITDSGIGMICNVLSQTLSRLLLALCPNITSSGIQFATAQLPLLQLIDCGMSIQDSNSQNDSINDNVEGISDGPEELRCQKVSIPTSHVINQKLIIKHGRLKKLSLWGCSGLDALYLNCLELNDLNLNSCTNLHPERLLLQCPKLKSVHASGCQDMLVGAIKNQVLNEFASVENQFRGKRSADGSKRVHVPYLLEQQPSDDHKQSKRLRTSQCSVHVG